MADVDPQLNQIPRFFLENPDPDVRHYFENLERYRHDMWVRTGGGNDAIENAAIEEKYPWPTGLQSSDIEKTFNFPQASNEPRLGW